MTRQQKIDRIEAVCCYLGPTHEWSDEEIDNLFNVAIRLATAEHILDRENIEY